MKYTLLEMTQDILASMDSDEVNSISDTTEATQVARIIRQAYYDLVGDLNSPSHYDRFELIASGDNTKPTLMYLPEDISKVSWIKYDRRDINDTSSLYQELTYLPLKDFLNKMYVLDTDDSNVGTFTIQTTDLSEMPVNYLNDGAPLYYTTTDENIVLFDSYDSNVDTTLQKSKTDCYGRKSLDFLLEDDFTPELDEQIFSRLLNESKVLAFAELKSVSHAVAERNAKRSRNNANRKTRVLGLSDFEQLPYFGRK